MVVAIRNAVVALGLVLGVWLAVAGAPAIAADACACVMAHAPGSDCCCEGEGDGGAVCEEGAPAALIATVPAPPVPVTLASVEAPARWIAAGDARPFPSRRPTRPRALDPPAGAGPPLKIPLHSRLCKFQV